MSSKVGQSTGLATAIHRPRANGKVSKAFATANLAKMVAETSLRGYRKKKHKGRVRQAEASNVDTVQASRPLKPPQPRKRAP